MRAIEQAVERRIEAVLLETAFVIEHAGLQPRDGIQQGHGSDLAARQYEVAQAQLVRDMGIDEALVQALVAAAQQDCALPLRPLGHHGMAQRGADRGEQHHGSRLGLAGLAARLPGRLQAALQRFGHHHHARTAAEGAIVHAPVVALGMVARIPQVHADLARA